MKGVICSPLKCIPNEKGDIYHALKKSESSFVDFGEAYFTSILGGEIKGWKQHTLMTMNLIVPVGSVIFYIHDDIKKETKKININKDNYCRLTVSPGLWVAFEGVMDSLNLVLNIASMEHDPSESINKPIEFISLG